MKRVRLKIFVIFFLSLFFTLLMILNKQTEVDPSLKVKLETKQQKSKQKRPHEAYMYDYPNKAPSDFFDDFFDVVQETANVHNKTHRKREKEIDLEAVEDLSPIVDKNKSRNSYTRHSLTFQNRTFFLNKKPIRIFGGSLHYFRVFPSYWKDRLLKLKACGLNTVTTVVPWNLHEPSARHFNFRGRLNLRRFVKLADSLGLYVILRVGPYVFAHLDYGGLPGWLLRGHDVKIREDDPFYITQVKNYFKVLVQKIADLQYSEGGPIIMFQVEQNYASFGKTSTHQETLIYLLRINDVSELIVTSENSVYLRRDYSIHKYALPGLNLDNFNPNEELWIKIKNLDSNFPLMVMDLQTGQPTFWGQRKKATASYEDLITSIVNIINEGGSFNLYMFHGGTNFGFISGAINTTEYMPMCTSYDFDAPLTESGDTTLKYRALRNLMQAFYNSQVSEKTDLPSIPPSTEKASYGNYFVKEMLPWEVVFRFLPNIGTIQSAQYMEHYSGLPRFGSCMGYIIYSHTLVEKKKRRTNAPGFRISNYIHDRLLALINNKLFKVLDTNETLPDIFVDYDWFDVWGKNYYEDESQDYAYFYDHFFLQTDWEVPLLRQMKNFGRRKEKEHKFDFPGRVDFIVENQGRVSDPAFKFKSFRNQRKGIEGPIFRVTTGIHKPWEIRRLEFSRQQVFLFENSVTWYSVEELLEAGVRKSPSLFRVTVELTEKPRDTFVRLKGWGKGVVIVNAVNIGRYWEIGPQLTLYIPARLLKKGKNKFLIFEEEKRGETIQFVDQPIL